MKHKNCLLIIISAVIVLLAGCGNGSEAPELTGFQSIGPEEALERLENEPDIILLDVRTPAEYAEGHIPGSLLMPLQTLAEEAPEQLTDKEAPILFTAAVDAGALKPLRYWWSKGIPRCTTWEESSTGPMKL